MNADMQIFLVTIARQWELQHESTNKSIQPIAALRLISTLGKKVRCE